MSTNDITGDKIATKPASDAFRNNFDAIFRKKDPAPAAPVLKTCIKCPRDVDMRCNYCGLRQSDGSVDDRPIPMQQKF